MADYRRVTDTPAGVLLEGARHFDLDRTLDCGQCFRFNRREDGGWRGVACGRALTMRDTEAGILFGGVGRAEFEAVWRRYFDLDREYDAALAACHASPALAACVDFAPGIRVLRQEAWEALASFILSQNNNIPRVKGIVERLCNLLGLAVGSAGEYAFPSADAVAAADGAALAPLRAGWRAAYLLDAAERVADGRLDLAAVAALPLEEARAALREVKGVGPKVADCVLLYGMGRTDAFPMDVWMKRAMTGPLAGLAPADLGDHPGIVQQYIFHFMRCGA